MADIIIAQQLTKLGSSSVSNGFVWRGQSFTTVDAIDLIRITIFGLRNGTIGNAIVELYAADVNDAPTGPLLGSKAVPMTEMGTDVGWDPLAFEFEPITLDAATKYAFVVEASGSDFSLAQNVGGGYADGLLISSVNKTDWTHNGNDLTFIVEGQSAAGGGGGGSSQFGLLGSWGW